MASSRTRFANTNKLKKQLSNSVLVDYQELLRLGLCYLALPLPSADNTNFVLIIPYILLDLIQ